MTCLCAFAVAGFLSHGRHDPRCHRHPVAPATGPQVADVGSGRTIAPDPVPGPQDRKAGQPEALEGKVDEWPYAPFNPSDESKWCRKPVEGSQKRCGLKVGHGTACMGSMDAWREWYAGVQAANRIADAEALCGTPQAHHARCPVFRGDYCACKGPPPAGSELAENAPNPLIQQAAMVGANIDPDSHEAHRIARAALGEVDDRRAPDSFTRCMHCGQQSRHSETCPTQALAAPPVIIPPYTETLEVRRRDYFGGEVCSPYDPDPPRKAPAIDGYIRCVSCEQTVSAVAHECPGFHAEGYDAEATKRMAAWMDLQERAEIAESVLCAMALEHGRRKDARSGGGVWVWCDRKTCVYCDAAREGGR